MSAELDSIISAAITTIDSGGSDGGDTGDSGSGGDGGGDLGDAGDAGTPDLPAEAAADAGADAGAEVTEGDAGQPAAADPAGTPDSGVSAEELAWQQELADMGIPMPKPGQKDNRIPHSRVSKIIKNAKAKWSEKLKAEHTAELTAREAKIKEYEEQAKQYQAAEQLIETDADRYVALLATIYPDKYKRFTKAQIVAAEKREMAEAPKEPPPDVRYEDGTVGYSPEQFQRLREFDRQEAARIAMEKATKEFNARFGPIEQQFKTAQQQAQDVQRVRGHIGKLRDQWGADLIDNPEVQKEIIAHLDANPKVTLVEATRVIAMKRIAADRTKMRAELLKELQGAPRAAAKAPAAPVKSDAAANETIDDIIAKAARGIR